MKLFAVSDTEIPLLCNPASKKHFSSIDLLVSCGDLSNEYLACLADILNAPLCYVRGNHQGEGHTTEGAMLPPIGTDLHARSIHDCIGLILAGVQGCVRYNIGQVQYSQSEMWMFVLRLVPALIANRVRYGRYLDIFVTHAPAWGILDGRDLPHQGAKAFRWLVQSFQPMLHLFGHIHLLRQDALSQIHVKHTLSMNVYGYREIEINPPRLGLRYPKSGMVNLVRKGIA